MADTNGTKNGMPHIGEVLNERLEALLHNEMTFSRQMFQRLVDPRRDINSECGYPDGFVNIELYRDMYDREPIANRVCELLPRETWQAPPRIYEEESSDKPTEFEEAWDDLGKRVSNMGMGWHQDEEGSPISAYLLRADIRSGIGHFGLILLGIDDGKNLQEPVEGSVTFNWKREPIKRPVWNHKRGDYELKQVGSRIVNNGKTINLPDSPCTPEQEKHLLEDTNWHKPVWNFKDGRYEQVPIAPLTDAEKNIVKGWRAEREVYNQRVENAKKRGAQTRKPDPNRPPAGAIYGQFAAYAPPPSFSPTDADPYGGIGGMHDGRIGSSDALRQEGINANPYSDVETWSQDHQPTGIIQPHPKNPAEDFRGAVGEGKFQGGPYPQHNAANDERMPSGALRTGKDAPNGKNGTNGNAQNPKGNGATSPTSKGAIGSSQTKATGRGGDTSGAASHPADQGGASQRVGQAVSGTDLQYGTPGMGMPPAALDGTDQQYFGVQFGPSEHPAQVNPQGLDQGDEDTEDNADDEEGDNAPEDQDQAEGDENSQGKKPLRNLLFLRVFDESLVQIVRYEWNVFNPRFGRPVMYRITLNDPREQHSGVGLPMATVFVHWTRVIHLADNLGNSEIFGVPRQRPVLNRLLDLRKLYSASAEGYWKSCFQGLQFSTHPQLGGDVEVDVNQVKDVVENYSNSLQRFLIGKGGQWTTIAPSVVDPSPHINSNIEAICICIGCPVRVFKGSERGELASSQDDSKWNDILRHRQHFYVTPLVICPFVDRLIQLGILPEPEGYSVEWPDLESLGDAAKAAILLQKTQAYAAYAQGLEALIPPLDYMTRFDGMDEEEAQEIIDAAQQAHEDQDTMTMPPQIQGQPAAPPEGTLAKDQQDHQQDMDQQTLDAQKEAGAFAPKPPAAAGAKPAGTPGAAPTAPKAPEDIRAEYKGLTGNTYRRLLVANEGSEWNDWIENIFCPKGKGGGVDATCKKGTTGSGGTTGAAAKSAAVPASKGTLTRRINATAKKLGAINDRIKQGIASPADHAAAKQLAKDFDKHTKDKGKILKGEEKAKATAKAAKEKEKATAAKAKEQEKTKAAKAKEQEKAAKSKIKSGDGDREKAHREKAESATKGKSKETAGAKTKEQTTKDTDKKGAEDKQKTEDRHAEIKKKLEEDKARLAKEHKEHLEKLDKEAKDKLEKEAKEKEAKHPTEDDKSGLPRSAQINSAALKNMTSGQIHQLLADHAASIGQYKEHGMANTEDMKGISIDGMKVHFSKETKNGAVQLLSDLYGKDSKEQVHPTLAKATKEVVFSTQRNSEDAHWEKAYGMANFKSAATGGDGKCVVYNGKGISVNTFAHESGHNLANQVWGKTEPHRLSSYGKAQEQEKPVTKYGSNNASEDFAEAAGLYTTDKDRFKQQFPQKYAALKSTLENPDKHAAAHTDFMQKVQKRKEEKMRETVRKSEEAQRRHHGEDSSDVRIED